MKTKQQVGESIFKVLSQHMCSPYASSFHTDARLREDLALDSSATLQLLVYLELEYGLALPEDALMNQDFDSVRKVAKLLYDAQERPSSDKILEYEEDIKLHCFVSCLSEIIKRRPGLDHRPLYFGVWDSEVVVSDDCVISYHSESVRHDYFVEWYEKLYGIHVWPWYDRTLDKEQNVARLTSLVEARADNQHIMVMLDMHKLPERVNEFNKDPFPHYLMLGTTPNADEWMVYDPDYRWEGVLKKNRILNAMRSPSVAGGYMFTDEQARDPNPRQIKAYFDACFDPTRNPMTDAIRQVLSAHLCGQDKRGNLIGLPQLGKALEEVPVLAIRKYAYEHGLAFFWRELGLVEAEFDDWCEVIAELVKTYKVIQYQALKAATTSSRSLADKIFEQLDQQDVREHRIKSRLNEVFAQWCDKSFTAQRVVANTGAIQ